MTCQPYNPLGSRIVLICCALLLCLVRPVQAQWYCGPVWVTPHCDDPCLGTTFPYSTYSDPYVRIGPQGIITRYPPAVSQDAPLSDAAHILSRVPGQLRIDITESCLNRLLARRDTDAGPVRDFILGASVSGSQNTETHVSVDVQPSPATARIFLQLTGITHNQTIGVTPEAAVQSRGAHQFRLNKQIDFDGLKFTTRTPAAWVTPQLTNERASTVFSGVPLIGPVADQIALSEAERRRPASEQIITQRVTDQVAPRFNTEIDQKLSDANGRLSRLIPDWLGRLGLTPPDAHLSSTDDRLLLGLTVLPGGRSMELQRPPTLPGPELLLPSEPPPAEEDDSDLTIIRQTSQTIAIPSNDVSRLPSTPEGAACTLAIHQSFLNDRLGQLPLAGREIPDRTIDRLLQLVKDALTGTPPGGRWFDGLGGEEPEFATIVLAEGAPVTFRFENGNAVVTIHAGFRPLLTPEVPTLRIEIPFSLQPADGRLTLAPGEVTVESLSAGDHELAELAAPVIRQQITSRLQPIALPASMPLRLPGMTPTTLTLGNVTLSDGWIVVTVD